MNRESWLRRLREQCPGWYVWWWGVSSQPGTEGWYGSPVPRGTPRATATGHPNRLGPYGRPQELRAAMRERYGAGDHCGTCAVPWEQCGHRQPETTRERGRAVNDR